ncbi:hypothetical protein C8J57DRAFT_1230457 [Mycena rebaudengoi]|nr:hypothetical protein C8J57DRAFT_1230457 [Mycena rebaudengoi]
MGTTTPSWDAADTGEGREVATSVRTFDIHEPNVNPVPEPEALLVGGGDDAQTCGKSGGAALTGDERCGEGGFDTGGSRTIGVGDGEALFSSTGGVGETRLERKGCATRLVALESPSKRREQRLLTESLWDEAGRLTVGQRRDRKHALTLLVHLGNGYHALVATEKRSRGVIRDVRVFHPCDTLEDLGGLSLLVQEELDVYVLESTSEKGITAIHKRLRMAQVVHPRFSWWPLKIRTHGLSLLRHCMHPCRRISKSDEEDRGLGKTHLPTDEIQQHPEVGGLDMVSLETRNIFGVGEQEEVAVWGDGGFAVRSRGGGSKCGPVISQTRSSSKNARWFSSSLSRADTTPFFASFGIHSGFSRAARSTESAACLTRDPTNTYPHFSSSNLDQSSFPPEARARRLPAALLVTVADVPIAVLRTVTRRFRIRDLVHGDRWAAQETAINHPTRERCWARVEGQTVGKADEVGGRGLGDGGFGAGRSAGTAGGNGGGMAPRRVGKEGVGDDNVLVEENDAVFFIARPALVIGNFCRLVALLVNPNCELGLFPIALSNFLLLLDTGACRKRKGLGDRDIGLDERGAWDELVIRWDCHVQGVDELRAVVIEVRQGIEPAACMHHQQTQGDAALEGGLEDVLGPQKGASLSSESLVPAAKSSLSVQASDSGGEAVSARIGSKPSRSGVRSTKWPEWTLVLPMVRARSSGRRPSLWHLDDACESGVAATWDMVREPAGAGEAAGDLEAKEKERRRRGGKTYGEANLRFLYAGVGRGVVPEVGAAHEGGASFALGLGLRLEVPLADFLQGGALSGMTINGDQSQGRGTTVVVEKREEENVQPQSCHQGTIQLDDKNRNRIFLPKRGSQFNLPTTRRDGTPWIQIWNSGSGDTADAACTNKGGRRDDKASEGGDATEDFPLYVKRHRFVIRMTNDQSNTFGKTPNADALPGNQKVPQILPFWAETPSDSRFGNKSIRRRYPSSDNRRCVANTPRGTDAIRQRVTVPDTGMIG